MTGGEKRERGSQGETLKGNKTGRRRLARVRAGLLLFLATCHRTSFLVRPAIIRKLKIKKTI